MGRLFRVTISGRSMLPALSPGDRLVAMRVGRVRRGDVWVFRHGSEFLVKRIAGLPGDRILVGEDRTVIGNESAKATARHGPQPDRSWILGPDEYFLLGDNAAESTDLRAFGPMDAKSLVGRVLFRYWPRPGSVRQQRLPEPGSAAPRSDGGTLPER